MLVGGRCRNFKRVSDSVYNFSCPLCGDSKKHPRKARGYITSKQGRVSYTCHKCGEHKPFHAFLKEFDGTLYREYQIERVKSGLFRSTRTAVTGSVPQAKPVREETKPTFDPLGPLDRVDTLKPTHVAYKFCESRGLPDFTRLYHCPLFYAWSNYVLSEQKFSDKALFYDHPRLVIPFFGADGKMIGYQGRDYRPNSDAKYVTILTDDRYPKIYGLDRLQPGSDVYAVEGPIDSMFLPNGIAFAGGKHSVLKQLNCDPIIIYDNEPRSRFTVEKIASAIEDGYRVVIWPKYVSEKDVNDMVLSGLPVLDIIKDHTYSGLSAKLELTSWKR